MSFTIKARLGRGRSAETFAAKLEVDAERFDVVVKRPRAEFKHNTRFADAFIAWGESQRDVDHENVVAVLEVGRTEDGPYVLQELVEGAPLSAVISMLRKRKRTLTPALAVLVAEQAAIGLAHLHQRGLVHSGLDTGEVMLSYEGDAKIGDQGLRTLDHHLGKDLLEEPDAYRAPEVNDVAQSTQQSDVYALGLIMLEMLIGTAVWTSESMTVMGSVAALKDFTHVGQAQPLLTDDLVRFLKSCLAFSPAERITAARAVEQLEALVERRKLREEKSVLGEFVKALVPPPESDAAPTMMVDPEKAAQIAADHSARIAHYEGKSVPLDPDLERKALTRAAEAPSVPMPDPVPAPSNLRERAHSVPDVAKVAQQASVALDRRTGRTLRLGAMGIGLLLLLVIAVSTLGGGQARRLRLRVTSVPPGANVFVDGSAIGATPIDQQIDVAGETVKLRFMLDGYREHQVTIGTDATELRYEAPLDRK